MEWKKKSASGVFIGGMIVHPLLLSWSYSVPDCICTSADAFCGVQQCFSLWTLIHSVTVETCVRLSTSASPTLMGITYLTLFTRPCITALIITEICAQCHGWGLLSYLRFANGAFLKGSVKKAGKMMSRQKTDAQLSSLLAARLASPVWFTWCLSPVSCFLSPVSHCLSSSYWLDCVHIYPSCTAAGFPASVVFACCCGSWDLGDCSLNCLLNVSIRKLKISTYFAIKAVSLKDSKILACVLASWS